MPNHETEHHDYDVLIVGAGGAGLRAAIESTRRGLRTAILTKSLLGKAHTVMAEGGVAAAMGNVYPEDNWKVHFRDTMRGGKMLNNFRMAELHAQESPDRVHELEAWGALFDRTPDGRILQRDFGGHRFARLAHVGDRTGLEMIRTLQQKVVSMGVDVIMECKVLRILTDADGRTAGCVAYLRASGEFVTISAPAIVLATGGVGKSWKYTSNSWESTGDGHALALWAGAQLIDMECIQFHPTGMVWPLSVRGLLVTEGVRGDGGVLRNSDGDRFMFNYVADMFRAETADSEEEADRWYDDHSAGRRPPELLPRDEVARAINTEVKAGRGTPHGGVYLDIATRRSAEFIRRRLPTTSSWSSRASTSRASRWRSARRATTSWAASASTPTPPRRACPGSSPRVRSPAACTARTASAATRSATCWSSVDAPGWARRTTSRAASAPASSTRAPSTR
jgi:succinate dehydrogenase / fumarate reductase, flavoprotein subunit